MRTARRALIATSVSLALAGGAAAQDGAARPGGPDGEASGGQPEPRFESGIASGGGTGFVLADGGFGDLPERAPAPSERPLDPEDREEVDRADAEAEALPESGPAPADPPVAIGPDDLPDAPDTATAGDAPDPSAIPPVRRQLAESDAEFAQCTAALAELGTRFETVPPLTETRDPDCGIARPILVAEIVPGVALRPDAVMRCATARALAQWVATDVREAADALGASVTAIDHGSTYVCRRRNNRPTGKLSEHSFGNAVDVMGFRFAARDAVRIEPREPGGPVAAFQRAVREASCEHFTTVIGPGTDAAHADHIHLDIKQRRGDYRLCQ